MGVNTAIRVLIVEDESLVAMLVEDMLVDAGFSVTQILSALPDALACVEAQPESFDVAILDVNLGGAPIFPLAEALAEAGKPFVFATGYGAGSLPPAWRGRPTLQKPFNAHDAIEALHTVLKRVG
jgi:CheY-like chemotaxis protein